MRMIFNNNSARHIYTGLTNKAGSAFWIVSICIFYFVIAHFSLTFVFRPEGIAAIWPPDGIFLCAILLTRHTLRPFLVAALFITDLIAEIHAGIPLNIGIVYSFVLAGEAVLSSWLLIRYTGEPVTFDKSKDVFIFLFLAVIASNTFASLIAAFAPYIFMGYPYWISFKWWWLSDGIGNLLITPFILSWANLIKSKTIAWDIKRAIEGSALFISLFLVDFFAFEYFSGHEQFPFYLNFLTFPFLIWAALRFGVPGASTAVIIFSAIAIRFVLAGKITTFDQGSILESVMIVQMYLAIISISSLFLGSIVTERKKTAEAFEKGEEKYRRIVETANEGIWMIDKDNKTSFVNDRMAEMLGYTKEEMIGKPLFNFMDEEGKNIALKGLERRKLGLRENFDFKLLRKDGTYLWTILGISPVLGEDNQYSGSLAMVTDISEHKCAESKLQESEFFFKESQRSAFIGSYKCDFITGFWESSEVLDRIFGIDKTYIKNIRGWLDIVHPDDRGMMDRYLKEEVISKGKPFNKEYRIVRKSDDKIRWVMGLGNVDFDNEGKTISMIGTIQDITERKCAEMALVEREIELIEAQRIAQVGSWDWDAKKDVVTWSQELYRIADRDMKLQAPTYKEHPQIYTPESMARLSAVVEKALQTGAPYELEMELVRPDGSLRWVTARGEVKRDIHGQVMGLLGTVHDITERKQVEEKIETSLREKEILLREIHHRVKNNMQIISSLLKLQAENTTDEKYLDLFKESQNRILAMSLVHEKLYKTQDFSRINARDYIMSVVNSIVQSYNIRPDLISINCIIEDTPIRMDSAIPCGLIINELVTNSVKYAFPDGKRGQIEVVLRKIDKTEFELRVGDNGIGLPEELDLRNTKTLGLHLVQILAENQLSGKIDVDRSGGIQFKIRFMENNK